MQWMQAQQLGTGTKKSPAPLHPDPQPLPIQTLLASLPLQNSETFPHPYTCSPTGSAQGTIPACYTAGHPA